MPTVFTFDERKLAMATRWKERFLVGPATSPKPLGGLQWVEEMVAVAEFFNKQTWYAIVWCHN